MNYDTARREVRKLLRSDKGDAQELPTAPIYKFVVGIMDKGKFVPLAAGMNWAEAVEDLKKRLASARAEAQHNKEEDGQ